jgi:hypothetical protein
MARTKDFGAAKDLSSFEPLTFTLAGQEFTCRPAIQGQSVMKLAASADPDNPSSGAIAVQQFFKVAMDEENYKKFDELTTSPDHIIEMSTLSEIVQWLMEEYTNRPTKEPTP